MKTNITYSGVDTFNFANGGMKITILDGKLKYNFNKTKKDGSVSKAYEGYEILRPMAGDVLVAEVSEEEKTFISQKGKDKGKSVKYTDRKIMFFYTDPVEREQAQYQPPAEKDIQLDEEIPTVEPENTDDTSLVAAHRKLDRILELLAPNAKTEAKPLPLAPSFPTTTEAPKVEAPSVNKDDGKDIKIEDVPF